MTQRLSLTSLLVLTLFLTLGKSAGASSIWYVDGIHGSDQNNCRTPVTACKTIGHAISLAGSGDTIIVAAATYQENLNIGFSLTVLGSGVGTPIIDGGGVNTVVAVSNANAHVSLSKLIVQNGFARLGCGGGIGNSGILAISNSVIRGNRIELGWGGGICNSGIMTINNSTISGNQGVGNIMVQARGGGIFNKGGTLTINNSTVSGNNVVTWGSAAGILNDSGALMINNSTISGNSGGYVGGIDGTATLQNSIVASNPGRNCYGGVTSNGYNLSSDGTCNFHNTGDLNNTDPKLGPLQNNGGPTQTEALLDGSPAIDAGNSSGCTDGSGHLLRTDQRGMPRPDHEDTRGCDMGAYERQTD